MKSNKSIFITLLVLIAALALPIQLAAQTHTQYTLTFVGNFGGSFSSSDGLNGGGSVAGKSFLTGDTALHAFLWRKGLLSDLGTLGGPNSAASEGPMINDSEQVVGFSDTPTLDPNAENFCGIFGDLPNPYICLPFVWRDGVMTALPTLGGNNGDAAGINNRGQVAGVAETSTIDPTCNVPDFEAVIWGPEKGEIQELPPLPSDTEAIAGAINDNGVAVGASGNCLQGPIEAVLWKNGLPTDLGNLGGTFFNIAFDINNRGQVVGQSDLPGDTTHHAFLWQHGVMNDLGTLPGFLGSLAQAINNKGQVVGYADDFNGNTVALIWQNGVMADLNTLVLGGGSTLFLLEALGINDHGQIAVAAFDANSGDCCAFLLTPSNGEIAAETATPAAQSPPRERPRVVVPENVRTIFQRQMDLRHHWPGLRSSTY